MRDLKGTRVPVLFSMCAALFLVISLTPYLSGAQAHVASRARDYTVHLKARAFEPAPGLSSQQRAQLAAQAAEVAVDGRLHVFLQFDEHPDAAHRARLARQGVRLLTYLPNYTWYASVPVSMVTAGRLPTGARWMGAIRPEDKMAPVLKEGLPTPGTPLRLYLVIHPDVTLAEAAAAVEALGGTVLDTAPEFYRLHVEMPGPESLPALAASDLWYWITREPPPKRRLNDGSRVATRTNQVHAAGYHGNPGSAPGSIVLAVWDGGWVATTHAAFSGRLIIGDPNPWASVDEHATHVAGTMAGSGAGSPPGRDLRGHADQAQIISYDWNLAVIEHRPAIARYDIDVSQNSWGVGNRCPDFGVYDISMYGPQYDAIVNGVFGKRVSVLFAAGNQQRWCPGGWDTVNAPATAKNIIAVGATNSDDKSMTDFSSWGPVNDGRLKPDVVAPGCEKRGEGAIWSTLPPNRYGDPGWCGTSMATPAVSGIVGLLLEAYNLTYGKDPWPSTLKAVLIHTAEDLGNPGPDYRFGYGHVDAWAGVNLIIATGNGNTSLYIRQDAVDNGQVRSYTLNSDGTTPLKCTLVWDDKEGTVSSSKALINDLDLRLIAPDGSMHLPWVLDPANPAAAATSGDNTRDNVEQVVVSNPQAGQWTVQVVGDSVPQGPEEFSLVCPFGQVIAPTPTATATPTATPTPTPTPTPQSGVSIDLYTNQSTYQQGDTMELGMDLTNPGPTQLARLTLRLQTPWQSYTFFHRWAVLPAGLNYSNPTLVRWTLPPLPAGDYAWVGTVAPLGSTPVQDTAPWTFVAPVRSEDQVESVVAALTEVQVNLDEDLILLERRQFLPAVVR